MPDHPPDHPPGRYSVLFTVAATGILMVYDGTQQQQWALRDFVERRLGELAANGQMSGKEEYGDIPMKFWFKPVEDWKREYPNVPQKWEVLLDANKGQAL